MSARRLALSRRGVEVALSVGLQARGPCLVCACGLDALHRIVDAIRDRHRAGDSVERLASDYEISMAQARALCEVA